VNLLSFKQKRTKKRTNLLVVLGYIIILSSVIACFVSIVTTQATLSEKRKELETLEQKKSEIQNENSEYQRLLDNNDMNSYMEALAIENMNYAYPDEIRFYDTSRN